MKIVCVVLEKKLQISVDGRHAIPQAPPNYVPGELIRTRLWSYSLVADFTFSSMPDIVCTSSQGPSQFILHCRKALGVFEFMLFLNCVDLVVFCESVSLSLVSQHQNGWQNSSSVQGADF